jgi:hypothetical protein
VEVMEVMEVLVAEVLQEDLEVLVAEEQAEIGKMLISFIVILVI